jgi:hypothetical protein
MHKIRLIDVFVQTGVSKGQLAEGYPSRLAVFGDGSGGELGWGFSLTELWSDLMDNHT